MKGEKCKTLLVTVVLKTRLRRIKCMLQWFERVGKLLQDPYLKGKIISLLHDYTSKKISGKNGFNSIDLLHTVWIKLVVWALEGLGKSYFSYFCFIMYTNEIQRCDSTRDQQYFINHTLTCIAHKVKKFHSL